MWTEAETAAVIEVIRDTGGATASEITFKTGLPPADVQMTLDQLVEVGEVVRGDYPYWLADDDN